MNEVVWNHAFHELVARFGSEGEALDRIQKMTPIQIRSLAREAWEEGIVGTTGG